MKLKNISAYLMTTRRVLQHPILFIKSMPWGYPLHSITEGAALFGDISVLDQYQARKFIKPGSIVIDGGANIGIFSSLAASLGATVYAFEPTKWSFEILQKTSRRFSHFHPTHAALGDHVGKGTIVFVDSYHTGSSSLSDSGMKVDGTPEEISIVTIDSLHLPRVDFIKLDTEGYEGQILKGAAETIRKHKPIIVMSAYHHPEDKEELPKILNAIAPYHCELHVSAEEDFICRPL